LTYTSLNVSAAALIMSWALFARELFKYKD